VATVTVANSNVFSADKDKGKYLDLIFRRNEREAIGRRVLIIIYILEGFSLSEVVKSLGCGKETYNSIKKELDSSEVNKEELLNYLREVFWDPFPKKVKAHYGYGSRTAKALMQILGGEKEHTPNRKVSPYKGA